MTRICRRDRFAWEVCLYLVVALACTLAVLLTR